MTALQDLLNKTSVTPSQSAGASISEEEKKKKAQSPVPKTTALKDLLGKVESGTYKPTESGYSTKPVEPPAPEPKKPGVVSKFITSVGDSIKKATTPAPQPQEPLTTPSAPSISGVKLQLDSNGNIQTQSSVFDSISGMPPKVQKEWSIPTNPTLEKIKTKVATANEVLGEFLLKVTGYVPQEFTDPNRISDFSAELYKKDHGQYPDGYSKTQTFNGKVTAGKMVAGIIDDAMIALLPTSGGSIQATRNVAKEGYNIVRGVKTAAAFSGFSALLDTLKGENIDMKSALIAGGLGAYIGAFEPTVMTGIPGADISKAKTVLSDYGIKAADLKNPELLKSKYRATVKTLHPDVGGNPEEFKAFNEAFNTVTSAGVNPGWKLTDISEWFNHLWEKNGKSNSDLTKQANKDFQLMIENKIIESPKKPSNIMSPQQAMAQVAGTNLAGTKAAEQLKVAIDKAIAETKNLQFNTQGKGEVVVTTPAGNKIGVDLVPAPTSSVSTTEPTQDVAVTPIVDLKSQQPDLSVALNKSDFEMNLKPKIDALPALKPGEVAVIQTGSGAWVDTQVDEALSRGTNENTKVMVVKESDLTLTDNPQKNLQGERLLKNPTQAINEVAGSVATPETTTVIPPEKPSKVPTTTDSTGVVNQFLRDKIGSNTFTVVEPTSGLWKSKGRVIYIRPVRPNVGFGSWLKSLGYDVQEAGGNNVYKLTLDKRDFDARIKSIQEKTPSPKPATAPKPEPKVKKEAVKVEPDKMVSMLNLKRTSIPALQGALVKDGKINFSNAEVFIKLNTDQADGYYNIVGKDLVKGNQEMAQDYPLFEVKDAKESFQVLGEQLVQTIDNSSLASAKDDLRPVLTGVRMVTTPSGITIDSTDGFRLYHTTMPGKVLSDVTINVPAKKLGSMLKLLGNEKITVSFSKSPEENMPDWVTFKSTKGEVILQSIQGNFPAIAPLYKGYTNNIVLDKAELRSALKEISAYSKINTDIMTLEIKDKEVIITGEYKDVNGEFVRKEVPVKIKDQKIVTKKEGIIPGTMIMPINLEVVPSTEGNKRGLNYKYFDDAAKALEGDNVFLDYNPDEPLSPVHISNKLERPETVEVKPPKAPSVPAGANASAGADTIGNFELRGTKTEATNYKLYSKVSDLIDKYAKTIGEGYLPKRAAGVYYSDTENIRINGMNDLAVATHEISHFLDHRFKISERLREVVGTTADGKPIYSKETKALRKEITDIYVQYYVGGKRTHPLKKRVVEGFATLIQKYSEQPTTITQQYPNLVTEFLTENGSYYEPVIGDILSDVHDFIADYQGLDPLDKIGARVTSENVVYDRKSFLNLSDQVRTQMVDTVYPLEKLSKLVGKDMTIQDPSLYVRQYLQINGIVANNLIGNKGYFRYESGKGFIKTLDYNWKTLIDTLAKDKTSDSFGYYLVSRASYYDYQLLKEYKSNVEALKQSYDQAVADGDNPMTLMNKDGISLADEYKEAQKLYNEQETMLRKDGITETEATDAYMKNKNRFAKDEQMFDELTAQDLELLHEKEVGMLSDKQFEDFKSRQGYASRKRQFFDEIVGEEQSPNVVKVGKSTVSSLIQRKGSSRTILNPVYSGIRNHSEIIKKAYRQVVYNKVNELAPQLPELAQKQELIKARQNNGSFHYPQDKDPNIIMGRVNGKRTPVLWDSLVKTTLDELITPANYGAFEQLLLGVSRTFTKGTTGLFPAFAATNWLGDQITLVANTTNETVPLASAMKELTQALVNKNSPQAKYYLEYIVLGGERQTFVGWQDLSPQELSDKIQDERKGLLKVVDAINGGLDILAIPSKYSELSTRATEYIKSRLSGKPQIVALEEAGRVTAPFHHVGKWGGNFGKVMIKAIPFFNPTLQVMDQMIRTAETPQGRKRLAFVVSAITAAAIGAMFLIMSKSTDDQKRLYKDLEAGELATYIWLPSPDGKSLIKIKTQQYGILGNIINMAIMNSVFDGSYKTGDFISGAAQILPQQFDVTDPVRALLAWIPPMIKVPLMVGLNLKDFPKILPLENQYLQSLPPGLRANEGTSYVAKEVGKRTGLSPVKLDYLITGIFGRTTGFILGKTAAYNPLSGVTRNEYFTSGRTIQGYYELKDKNDQQYKAMNDGILNVSMAEKQKIAIIHKKTLAIDKYLKDYREADLAKDQNRITIYRNAIVTKINELNQ